MPSKLSQFLPHILVGVALSGIILTSMVFSQAPISTQPKVTWQTNPITILFPSGSGSSLPVPDSFRCAPPTTGGVVLRVKTSSSNIILTVIPSSFSSCNFSSFAPYPDGVSITVSCNPSITPAKCAGTYTGSVQVRDVANYRNLPDMLKVSIIVT